MNRRTAKLALAGVATLSMALTVPSFVSAKVPSIISMPCTGTTVGSVRTLRRGDTWVLSMFGTSEPVGSWHTTIAIDDTIPVVDFVTEPDLPGFSIISAPTLVTRGKHFATFTASNDVTGETCLTAVGIGKV